MLEINNLKKSYGKKLAMKDGELVADDTPEKPVSLDDGKNLEDVHMFYFEKEVSKIIFFLKPDCFLFSAACFISLPLV